MACVYVQQIHATLSDNDFLEAYYKLYASKDSPSRRPWTREHFVPDANFHRACRLVYVAEPVGALWHSGNTEGVPLTHHATDHQQKLLAPLTMQCFKLPLALRDYCSGSINNHSLHDNRAFQELALPKKPSDICAASARILPLDIDSPEICDPSGRHTRVETWPWRSNNI